MTPSPYQQAIFDWVRNGSGNGIVMGVAGCGKTTTNIKALDEIPRTNRVLFLVFNAHIRDELQTRAPKNVQVETFNSFGWKLCRDNVSGVKLLKNEKDYHFLNRIVDPFKDKQRHSRLRHPIMAMVRLLKSLGHTDISQYQKVALDYGVEFGDLKPDDKYEDVLGEVYRKSILQVEGMSYDDQVFQPIFRDWDLPSYDNVFVDEAQDASPINIEYVKRLSEAGARAMLIGDESQSIYLFRGAHPDAMAEMAKTLNAIELPLSVCYRCGDAIIEEAKKLVPRIEAPVPNPNGPARVDYVSTADFLQQVKAGDMVVCRQTAPLIKRCLQLNLAGKKAFVKGRDFSQNLINLIEKVHGNPSLLKKQYTEMQRRGFISDGSDIGSFLTDLNDYAIKQKQRLEAFGRDDEADLLMDRIEAIEHIAESVDYVIEVIFKIEAMFSDTDDTNAVRLMTGHKSKGLEAPTVWHLRPDLCPSKRAKTAAQQKQEMNLLYVMGTRGRQEYLYVEKERDEK